MNRLAVASGAVGAVTALTAPLLLAAFAAAPAATSEWIATGTAAAAAACVRDDANDDTAASDNDAGALDGNEDAGKVAAALLNGDGVDLKGLTFDRKMVAGMFGNFQQESGVHFKVTQGHAHDDADNAGARAWVESTGQGLGLAQWSGGRGTALVDYAQAKGETWSGFVQVQFLIDELAGTYRNAYDAMRDASDARQAAKEFHTLYEISADATPTARMDRADTWEGILEQAGLDGGASASDDGGGDDASSACVSDDGSERIDAYMSWAKEKAADDAIGYSQSNRRLNPDVDCSSFVFYALRDGGGFSLGDAPFNTRGMEDALSGLGFEKVGGADMTDLRYGDILLEPQTHTEFVLDAEHDVGAHDDRGHPEGGDQDGNEVSVSDRWTGFTQVWRWPGDDGDDEAVVGEVGGAPTDRSDFGWMCDTGLHVCNAGDHGVPPLDWGGSDYQCYWYWYARMWLIHGGDVYNPHTSWGGELAAWAASAAGWTRSDAPKPGAGVSFIQGSINHVAVVEKVEGSGGDWTIVISEGNADGSASWNSYNVRTLTKAQYEAQGGQGFFWKDSWGM